MLKKAYLLVLFCVICGSQLVLAQVTTATITGTIRDETGAVVPGVSVDIRNVDTGTSRAATSDAAGRYRAPQLSLGTYEVQTELQGFRTEIRSGITLTVGAEAVVDFVMTVGAVTERITVTGEASLVETSGAAVSGLVGEREMGDLPLNGRSFDQLLILDSSASSFRYTSQSGGQGFANKFTIAGQRWESNKFYQDGTEMVGSSRMADLPGSASKVQLGVDAIREFRLITNNYDAEYGKKTGGVIDTVTKSGTNELHGSAFAFHRNDNLDARNFFDPGAPPEFKRNNFGASLGGPIMKDRAFIFGNYEGLRERLGITQIAIVMDENARMGLLPDEDDPVPINPAVVPYLELMPDPNGRNFGDGTAETLNAATTATNDDYFTTRFDYQIADSDSFFLSYTIDDAELNEPLDNPFFGAQATTQNHTATLQEMHIFSPQLLHVFHVGFNRPSYTNDTVELINVDPSLGFSEGLRFGVLEHQSGLSTIGGGAGPNAAVNNLFQFSEQLLYTRGSHSWKFGWQLHRRQINEASTDRLRGSFRFRSLKDFLAGKSNRFRGAVPPGVTGTLNVGVPVTTVPEKGWRQTYFALYAQDTWKVTNNLSLDLGLRFEYAGNPSTINDRTTRWVVERVTPEARFLATTPLVGEPLFDSSNKLFNPRFGLAWDPFGRGTTSIRAGAGMFHEIIDNIFRFFADINPPFSTRADLRPPTITPEFPRPFLTLPTGDITVTGRTVDPNMEPTTVFHFNVAVQQELAQDWVLKLRYTGSRAVHLSNSPGVNTAVPEILPDGRKFWARGLQNANPIIGPVEILESNVNSWYHAFNTTVEKRFGSGTFSNLRLKWAYTFAKSTDQASTNMNSQGGNTRSQTLDPLDINRDHSLSSFDIRHTVAFNFTYGLPSTFSGGVAAGLFNDWAINGILQANTGFPRGIEVGINQSRNREQSIADRPDLIPGGDNNPVLGGPDQYFDVSQFSFPEAGFHGNLGRNTLTAPGLANFDFSLVKDFPITERSRFQFRAEFFNLFNRPNFGTPAARLFRSRGRARGSAGRISNTVTTSRQIQFGLRFEF